MAKIVTTALAFFALGIAAAAAQPAAEFFKGKTVTYVVATAPGGGYDTYGRLITRYMPKYVTGAKMVVKNVPGAGHIVGTNTVYAAKPDGLTIGTFNTGLIFAELLKDEGIKFDLAKMSWIGKASSDPRAMVLTKNSGLKELSALTDAGKPPHKIAAAGLGSSSYIDMKLVAEALHLNVELIPGFNGNEGEMSMLRGEVVGTLGSLSSMQPFVDNGNGIFVLQVGGTPKAGIPDGMTLVKDERGKQLMSLVAAEGVIGRLTAGPPDMPADRLEYLRSAYMKTLSDPEFLAEAKKLDVPIDAADGQTTEKIVKQALAQTPETVKLLATVVNAK
jgi:tripartite-type tricarboxylate transporter receptor subunit TctC